MNILTLHLKQKWFDQIASGDKTVELRLATNYWRKRLIGRTYDEIHLYCGYPKKGDTEKRFVRKWNGVSRERVLHEEFGAHQVDVFMIDVSKKVSGHEA